MNTGRPLNPVYKFLTYYTFVLRKNGTWDPQQDALIYYQLFLKRDPYNTYIVRKKDFHGTLRLGFVIETNRFLFSLIGNWRTQEFYSKRELPRHHYYGSFKVAYKWD